LKAKGIDSLIVRNPITCQASRHSHPGAVCQLCAGIRETGLPPTGSFLGVIAGTTLAEPLCLAKGTLVLMADLTEKPIEAIHIGDTVFGVDLLGKVSPVNVTNTFYNGVKKVRTYTYEGSSSMTLTCTDAHKVLAHDKNEFSTAINPISTVVASEFSLIAVTGDLEINSIDGTELVDFVSVSAPINSETYDIEVDNDTHLFLLSNRLVVSNSQGMLNSKHSGGSARSASSFGGFRYVNQLFNIPEAFVHEAPLAGHAGEVSEVRPAPQGGNYVVVKHDGKKEEHYVHPDLQVFARVGQTVEPGDVLSDGIPNPAKIVKFKGIGEGRSYFSKAVKDTFENSQLGGINKRNFDIISKGLITHVKITNPKGLGNHLPDQIVNYHTLEKDYTARPDSKKIRTDAAKGLYLEIPELHYTIGTRLTTGMIDNLRKHGIDYVTAHSESPGFEPEMQRLLDVPAHEHDWMHALYSTNLERRLTKAVNTGASSSIAGPSPIPGLAYAVGFGGKKAESDETEELLSFE